MKIIAIAVILYLLLRLKKTRGSHSTMTTRVTAREMARETTRDDDRFIRMFRYGAPVLEHQYAHWAYQYGPIFFSKAFDKDLTKIQNDCRRGWNEFLKRISTYNACHEDKFV